ncbi:hypothetical protein DFH88_004456 [Clostridium saccharobutylicum]|nr:hypothetical protein [Clostridium saccharobutylicum]
MTGTTNLNFEYSSGASFTDDVKKNISLLFTVEDVC